MNNLAMIKESSYYKASMYIRKAEIAFLNKDYNQIDFYLKEAKNNLQECKENVSDLNKRLEEITFIRNNGYSMYFSRVLKFLKKGNLEGAIRCYYIDANIFITEADRNLMDLIDQLLLVVTPNITIERQYYNFSRVCERKGYNDLKEHFLMLSNEIKRGY